MKYDAVIFDLFGTLVDNASQEAIYNTYVIPATVLGVDVEKLAPVWLGIRRERDSGQFGSVAGDIRHVCDLLGLKPDLGRVDETVKQRLETYRMYTKPRATVISTLTKLRSEGFKIGLISDCGFEIPTIWDDFPFATLLDATVFSCCAGVMKPDPSLYKLACERLNVDPSRCLYVGDGGSRELTGARAMGMHPVLIRVDTDHHMDIHRPDAVEWTGSVISDISEVLGLVGVD